MTEDDQNKTSQNPAEVPGGSAADSVEDDGSILVVPPEALREALEQNRPLSIKVESTAMTHMGPLPPAAMMREYDEVHPGLSGVLVKQFQNESDHRRRLQTGGQMGALAVVGGTVLVSAIAGVIAADWRLPLAILGPVCGTVGIAQFVEFWLKLGR